MNLLPTIQELREQFELLSYFDKSTLKPLDPDALLTATKSEQELMQLAMEMMLINKLNTIAMNIEWELGHSYSPFKQKLYKEKLTNPATEANEFGNVNKWGMKMAIPGEWELYESFYNELFQHDIIEE